MLALSVGPAGPGGDRDGDDGAGGRGGLVLGVARGQEGDGVGRVAGAGEHGGLAVGAGPPELGPVVGVVVGQQGHVGVGRDVGQALEAQGALGFVVDRDVDQVAVTPEIGREGDRDQVRLAGGGDRRQAGHAGGDQAPAGLAGR